jgi:putative redox protein
VAFWCLEVRAEGERASGYPAVYTKLKQTYRVAGEVSAKAMDDAVRLSKEKYCSDLCHAGKNGEGHVHDRAR